MLIAITGNAGSGKTTVSKIFRNCGFKIINADEIGHNILKNNKTIKNKIIKEFGKEILDKNKVSREKLGNIVFNNKNKLKKLNNIIHPIIISEIKNRIKQKNLPEKRERIPLGYSQIGANFFVVDAALIFELKLEKYFDYVIVVKCSEKNIIKRAKNKDTIKKILKNQLPLKNKIKNADFIIDNNGAIKDTRKIVSRLIEKIQLE